MDDLDAASTVTIERLNLAGEGVAGDVRVAFTLPGEVVAATASDGHPARILVPSPDRATPVCPQFGSCGGCALQHGSDTFVARWKADVVSRALAARGLAAELRPMLTSPPESRRRATFAGRRSRKGVVVGFHGRRSEEIVAPTGCRVVRPELVDALPVLEAVTRAGASRTGALRLAVTSGLSGIDLDVAGGKPLVAALRADLSAIALAAGLARLAWEGEPVLVARDPVLAMGRARVVPPPGAFLQATAEGEAALIAAVREAIGPARHVADLFCGCGTFTLPLAESAEVLAVEGDAAAVQALDAAWRQTRQLRRVAASRRDLFRRPLLTAELAGIDAVVIDPPRPGAEAQSRALVKSAVPVIAAVSCNPVTFARDAAILTAGGYRISWVQPVDQFRWSPHVELVARFSRGA